MLLALLSAKPLGPHPILYPLKRLRVGSGAGNMASTKKKINRSASTFVGASADKKNFF